MEIKYNNLIDFLKCPALYKFKHDMGIKKNKNRGREFLKKSILETIYNFYNIILEEERIPSEKEFNNYWSKLYKENEDKLVFQKTQLRKRKIKYTNEFLKKFYIKNQYNPGIPIGVNVPFDIQVGEHKIIDGNIQLIRKKDKEIELLFYDNGKYYPDDFRRANDLRFTLVSYAFRKIFEEKEDKFIYSHPRKDKQLEVMRAQSDFNKAVNILDNIGEIIENKLYWQRISYYCKSCPYSDLCTEWDGGDNNA